MPDLDKPDGLFSKFISICLSPLQSTKISWESLSEFGSVILWFVKKYKNIFVWPQNVHILASQTYHMSPPGVFLVILDLENICFCNLIQSDINKALNCFR